MIVQPPQEASGQAGRPLAHWAACREVWCACPEGRASLRTALRCLLGPACSSRPPASGGGGAHCGARDVATASSPPGLQGPGREAEPGAWHPGACSTDGACWGETRGWALGGPPPSPLPLRLCGRWRGGGPGASGCQGSVWSQAQSQGTWHPGGAGSGGAKGSTWHLPSHTHRHTQTHAQSHTQIQRHRHTHTQMHIQSHTQTLTHTDTHTQTHRDTDTHAESHKDTDIHTQTHMHRVTHTDKHADIDSHTDTHRDTQNINTESHTETHTHRITHRHSHTQAQRHTQTHIHRHRDTHMHRHRHRDRHTKRHTTEAHGHEMHRDTETHRGTHTDTHRHTERHRDGLRHRHTCPAGRCPPAGGALHGVRESSWSPLPQLRPGVPVGVGDGRSWIECPGCERRVRKNCKRMPCLCGGHRQAGWEDHRPGQKREGVGTGADSAVPARCLPSAVRGWGPGPPARSRVPRCGACLGPPLHCRHLQGLEFSTRASCLFCSESCRVCRWPCACWEDEGLNLTPTPSGHGLSESPLLLCPGAQ